MKQVRLNKAEMWVADHALPVFAAVALAIIAGAVAIFVVFLEQEDTRHQVSILRPQVTKVSRAICDQESLKHTNRAERCAERIRIGLVNCRHSERCRAALLAALTYPPPARGATSPATPSLPGAHDTSPLPAPASSDTKQNPHGATQQPSPGSPGDTPGHGQKPGHGPENAPEPPPTPSPGAPPAPSEPPAHEPGPPAETPGNGPPASAGGGSASGPGVELCVLEGTCVGVEVGLGP